MFDIATYTEARTVDEAASLLAANPEACLIAGGTDILIKLREGKRSDAHLIGIRQIGELKAVTLEQTGSIRIGAAATFAQIATDTLINRQIPLLAQAVQTVGGPQIRRVATIGGNVCNGAVSADSAPTLLVLNTVLELYSTHGLRCIPLADFYHGPGKVDLRPGEILTALSIPADSTTGWGGHYIKYAMRQAMDIATLGCAVICRLGAENTLSQVRLAFGVAAPTPVRCPLAEQAVAGKPWSTTLAAEFGQAAAAEINPRTSWRASREFRLHLAQELAQQALINAFVKAGGTPL
ncbi:xanthine dehydrogenase subunit XdhB [Sporomusa sp.]|uniref:xanthine dehydrogenase subunit XdhB n=1 Tax=Sporomusa sp. TaxID=2078658 RepID=UPI002CE3A270|nr:xanthine dehydrogenase subunit XdhB [Sporomusa sp.]HWR45967.1 xanthine dehydrogenase subunit XdhB [Sporomusa sp.]